MIEVSVSGHEWKPTEKYLELERCRQLVGDLACERERVLNEIGVLADDDDGNRRYGELKGQSDALNTAIYEQNKPLWKALVDRLEETGGPLSDHEAYLNSRHIELGDDSTGCRDERHELDVDIWAVKRDIRRHEKAQGLPAYTLPEPEVLADAPEVRPEVTPVAALDMDLDDSPSGPGF